MPTLVNWPIQALEFAGHKIWQALGDYEFIKAWGPILIGLIGLFWIQRRQNSIQNKNNERLSIIAITKEQREEIISKLNQFYGPFKECRMQSSVLYSKFALKEKSEARTSGKEFRTLKHLLAQKHLSRWDQLLLNEILDLGNKQVALIEKYLGLVDKPELQELLGKLCAHEKMMQLSVRSPSNAALSNFDDITFPLEIDGAIESAILRLQDRLQELTELSMDSSKEHYRPSKTVRYYDDNAIAYEASTRYFDLTSLYAPFRENLRYGARILDAGCGVGRDTRYFIQNGFRVVSIDASKAMVKKCQEYPHAYCLRLSFEEIEFKESFDGIWACASLLHLTPNKARDAICSLTTALKAGGVIFLSLRKLHAKSHGWENGRYYQYYDLDSVSDLIQSDKRLSDIKIWETISHVTGDSGLWLNVLARKKSDTLPSWN